MPATAVCWRKPPAPCSWPTSRRSCDGRATTRGLATSCWSKLRTGLAFRRSCRSSWARVRLICSELTVAPEPLDPCGCVPHLRRVVPDADPGVPATEGGAGHSTRASHRASAQGGHSHGRRHPVRGGGGPRRGGGILLVAVGVVGGLFAVRNPPGALPATVALILYGTLGLIDDLAKLRYGSVGMPARIKFPLQILCAVPIAALAHAHQHPLRLYLDGLYWPLAIMAIICAANDVYL